MTTAIGRTPGKVGFVPTANTSTRGSWTASYAELPAPSVTTTKSNGPSEGHTDFRNIGSVLNICHLNIEGMSRSKSECLSNILIQHQVDILALQETHVEDHENSAKSNIPGYRLVEAIGQRALRLMLDKILKKYW
uniref:Endonuclease/exonuclease/phosphatase domain-containing protein n=1 Tax=Cuerna arida TaxID=1464854 RepID=A0A1B6H1M2_9HEMI